MQSAAQDSTIALRNVELHQKLSTLRHVALDLDGTIYRGKGLFPSTLPFLRLLKEHGIGYSFVTNNSSRGRSDYIQHLKKMGVEATEEQVVISTHATIFYLRQNYPKVRKLLILGTDSLTEEFRGAGFECLSHQTSEEPEAVVVGFDPALNYQHLCNAAWWIKSGKVYLATHPDRVCPTDERTVLVDCGAICAALREATGRMPDAVLGKPDPSMLDTILELHEITAGELAMVGDRLYTDLAMAHRVNALGVLVLSGETTLAEAAAADPAPDLVVEGLAEFGDLIRQSRLKFGSA